VLPRAGTVSKLTAYIGGDGTAGTEQFRAMIYSDAAGSPGTLAGTTGSISVATTDPAQAWDFVFTKPLPLTPGRYWLCLQSAGTSEAARVYWMKQPNAGVYAGDAYNDGPSQSFGVASREDHANSIFATYS
jgi:hypothetical protein